MSVPDGAYLSGLFRSYLYFLQDPWKLVVVYRWTSQLDVHRKSRALISQIRFAKTKQKSAIKDKGPSSNQKLISMPQSTKTTLTKQLPAGYEPAFTAVICAKGNEAKKHTGNGFLRFLVESNVSAYAAQPGRLKRSLVVSKILKMIRMEGGFVRKNPNTGLWYDVGDKCARDKIGQALRDALQAQGKEPIDIKSSTQTVSESSSSSSSESSNQDEGSRKRKRSRSKPVSAPLAATTPTLSPSPLPPVEVNKLPSTNSDDGTVLSASPDTNLSQLLPDDFLLEPLPISQTMDQELVDLGMSQHCSVVSEEDHASIFQDNAMDDVFECPFGADDQAVSTGL